MAAVAPEAGRSCEPAFGRMGVDRWPSSCWRPYAPDSPFNSPIPADASPHPRSREMVAKLVANASYPPNGGPDHWVIDGKSGIPVYWSAPDDPLFRLRCTGDGGYCETGLDGRRIRIPALARPNGGGDAHMTVVDQRAKVAYDFWEVSSGPRDGDTVVFSGGGMSSLEDDGSGSGAVAAHYGSLAGIVRAEEMLAGRIDHALVMTVGCVRDDAVHPASGTDGLRCDDDPGAPRMGERFQLDMSASEIDALDVPPWRKTVLHALAEYGAFVRDTQHRGWALGVENGRSYVSFGRPDKWGSFAGAQGWERDDIGYWVGNLRDGVDWRRHLRVVGGR